MGSARPARRRTRAVPANTCASFLLPLATLRVLHAGCYSPVRRVARFLATHGTELALRACTGGWPVVVCVRGRTSLRAGLNIERKPMRELDSSFDIAGRRVRQAGQDAAASSGMERLARFGYASKGVVYITVGVI